MAGRVLSPLGRITRTARAVAGSDLSRRIELDGPDDELKELADTFDEMLERLERAFTAQQRFVGERLARAADAAGDQPHAAGGAPLRSGRAGRSCSSWARRCWRPTSAASSWSRACCCSPAATTRSWSASRWTSPRSPRRPSTRCTRRPRPRGWRSAGSAPQAVVQGNGVLLERIALNLVQNAVRYNVPEDGWVEVTTEVAARARRCWWCSNTGPVVPAYEIDNLFEPFRRLRTERTGSDKGVGLGLSIVRSVARAHGGHIIGGAARGRRARDARHPARSETMSPIARAMFALRGIFWAPVRAGSCVIDHKGEFPAIYSP